MALFCLNCKAKVEQDAAKIFAGVFVCSDCFERAERLDKTLQAELQRLFLMTRESIRIALVEGKLHFGESKNSEVSKTEILRKIMQLEETREASQHPPARKS